uniref:Uncharacterized protein n=1 Tax=Cynoglossus semilaevis TaxID=244447 RepID=A0A3P8WAH1_CYNSE
MSLFLQTPPPSSPFLTPISPILSFGSRQRCPQAKGLETLAALVQSVEETPDPIPTMIRGTIPAWINGSFLRNGPEKFEFGKGKFRNTTGKAEMAAHSGFSCSWN